MTNEKALDVFARVEKCAEDDCPTGISCNICPYNVTEKEYNEAYDLALNALSNQCTSIGQADKSVIADFVAFQREWLNSHKTLELDAVNNALVNIFLRTTGKAFIDSLNQTSQNDEAIRTDDQCGDSAEMVELKLKKRTITERLIIAKSLIDSVIADSERVSLPEQKKSNSFSKEPSEKGNSEMNYSDVPDIHVGKTDFQPGDKFILELGAERRMFGEFEIKGTDLYVKTSLLEKLTRYEPEMKSEKIPYKKPEIIYCTECKKGWDSGTATINGQSCRIFKCSVWERTVSPFGYCYMAERRNDG